MRERSALGLTLRLIVVGLLAGWLHPRPGRSGPAHADSRHPEPMRQVAEEMATSWGLSVEEAYQRLRVEDPIGTLQVELAEWEADTFAGLWIENEPQYRVVVAFTRDGEKTLKPYLENRSIPGLTIRKARFAYAELEAMQARAMRELDKLDFHVNVSISVQDNRVELYVSDRAWFESELRRVGARLPEEVRVGRSRRWLDGQGQGPAADPARAGHRLSAPKANRGLQGVHVGPVDRHAAAAGCLPAGAVSRRRSRVAHLAARVHASHRRRSRYW